MKEGFIKKWMGAKNKGLYNLYPPPVDEVGDNCLESQSRKNLTHGPGP
jgi:hypothetical protein